MRKKDNRKNRSSHSAMVADRKSAALDLAGAFAAQGGTVAAGLEELLSAVLEEGEALPDLRFLVELLGRLVKSSAKELDEADADRWLAGMKMQALRSRCREVKEKLYRDAVDVRKALVDLYGADRCRRQFSLSERTPRGAEDLTFEVRQLVERLGHPELVLPEPRLPAVHPDPAGWADTLRPGLELLEELLGERRRRRIHTIDGVVGRRRALEAHDRTYQLAARTGEALFALSGNDELARRLRPPVRKPARQASDPRSWLRYVAKVRAAAAAFIAWLRGFLRWPPISRSAVRKPVLPVARGSSTAQIR
ncbi:MAG: hypothetical protein V3T72_12390 [Thermoanaerobaculia bacterium]